MTPDREFELRCEMRSENNSHCLEFYIDPNQFDGDLAFTAGADEMYDDEGEARQEAFYLARMNMQTVYISIFRDGKLTDEDITIKPTVTLA